MQTGYRVLTAGVLVALMIGLAVAAWSSTAEDTVGSLSKKLIEYGWDVPFPDFIREHITEMEKRPFDGIIFKLRGGGKVLDPHPWDEAQFQQDFDNVSAIPWGRFTDNFVVMWAASDQDWFNDEHWKAIEHNVALVARAARIAGCVGLCFDQEPYGTNPWSYKSAAHADRKSFAEYEQMVRKRGGQFMRAILSEFPRPKILTLFQIYPFSDVLRAMAPQERAQKLSEHYYGLMPAFLNGMLEAGGRRVTIIDGNEQAYYYTEAEQYFDAYHLMTQRGLLLVEPSLWGLYRTQFRAGQALYIDQYYGLRQNTKTLGNYMTPEEQAKWLEHNVYWALYTTDKYVWCYSERMSWWKEGDQPEGCEDAIRAAREKLEAGKPLGFDLAPIIQSAKEKQHTELMRRIHQKSAQIRRIPEGVARPKIDGVLDDRVWKEVTMLDPFVLLAAAPEREIAQTHAQAVYDSQALYVAFRCEEPQPDKMTIVGHGRDDPIWQGDDVEVVISPPGKTVPFYHFMLNPRGVFWDSINDGKSDDTSYEPQWQHGAAVGKDFWAAEAAIPWAALDMQAPEPGEKLRVNLCRQRIQGRELSAWSSMVQGFLEPDLFGTWTFQ